MNRVTEEKLFSIAEKIQKKEKKWHFHMLAPGCVFNKDKRFALILENSDDQKQFICFFLEKPAATGKKLAELLHGKGITKKSTEKSTKPLSPKVKEMLKRANELNLKGFSWHHHLLFPDCIFNKDSRYWTLVFEDPLDEEVMEDMTDWEPKEALQQIEPLFYSQKK